MTADTTRRHLGSPRAADAGPGAESGCQGPLPGGEDVGDSDGHHDGNPDRRLHPPRRLDEEASRHETEEHQKIGNAHLRNHDQDSTSRATTSTWPNGP